MVDTVAHSESMTESSGKEKRRDKKSKNKKFDDSESFKQVAHEGKQMDLADSYVDKDKSYENSDVKERKRKKKHKEAKNTNADEEKGIDKLYDSHNESMNETEMDHSTVISNLSDTKCKKRKHKIVEDMNGTSGVTSIVKSNSAEEVSCNVERMSKKKAKKQKREEDDRQGDTDSNDCSFSTEKVKNKKAKKNKEGSTCNDEMEAKPVLVRKEEINEGIDEQCLASSQRDMKKRKHCNSDASHDYSELNVICKTEENDLSKKHKKKKHKKNDGNMDGSKVLSSDNKCHDEQLSDNSVSLSDSCGDKKSKKKNKKKKKKTRNNSEHTEEAMIDVSVGVVHPQGVPNETEETEHKKKKKSKKDAGSKNVPEHVSTDRNFENESVSCDQNSSQKSTIQKLLPVSSRSQLLDAHSSQLADNISSPRQNVCKPLTASDCQSDSSVAAANLGQWNTATFEAADRQNKFFRLMGGRKTVSQAPSGDAEEPPKKSLFANMAMGKQQQHVINSALENQFERAREITFNQKRGTGLGFAAPPGEGKKFYIDSSKSASTKFDD